MQNVKMTVKGNKLTIEVDLDAPTTPSASQKTDVVATTRGNVPIADGKFMVGLNIYKPRS